VDVAQRRVSAAVQHERLAVAQFNRAIGEALDTNLRALQVGQNAYLASNLLRHLAHGGGSGAVIVGLTMGEVEAYNIHAFGNDFFEHPWCVGSGAQGGNNLGTAGMSIGSHRLSFHSRSWSLPELHGDSAMSCLCNRMQSHRDALPHGISSLNRWINVNRS
jgi:hypothetical protein